MIRSTLIPASSTAAALAVVVTGDDDDGGGDGDDDTNDFDNADRKRIWFVTCSMVCLVFGILHHL